MLSDEARALIEKAKAGLGPDWLEKALRKTGAPRCGAITVAIASGDTEATVLANARAAFLAWCES